MTLNGKGSVRRPYNKKKWDENFERVFGLKNKKKDKRKEN